MLEEAKIPCIFYLYLSFKLWESKRVKEISLRDLKKYLTHWKIPKSIAHLMIIEMEMLGLLKRKTRYEFEIPRPKFDADRLEYYHRTLINNK